MKKILVCGSHFTAAQAVVEKLLKTPDIEVEYVGRLRTMEGDKSISAESQILPAMGVKYHSLNAGRVRRSLGWETLTSFLKIPLGFVLALKLVREIRPDVVVSFGGYVSVPIVIVSKILGIPVMLHEQTLISGLSNRVCALFADRVAVSFADGDYSFDKKKMVLTGNPIRSELLTTSIESEVLFKFIKKTNKKLIYVTGGNQGAQAINLEIERCLPEILKEANVVWQTGDSKLGNYQRATDLVQKMGVSDKVLVQKWFDAADVSAIFKKADLIICRAGMNTLNEIAYFKQSAIVVPYPYLYKDEQLVNAKYFEKHGFVKTILQSELGSDKFMNLVKSELANSDKKKNQDNSMVKTDAAERITDLILSLIKG